MPVKTKRELIMITKLVKKYCKGKMVFFAMLSPDGTKNLGSLHQSIRMEQSRFNAEKKGDGINIRRVKMFEENLDNK